MGLFDTIRSEYKIFGKPHDDELQCKPDDAAMNFYWIDPAGRLWFSNYAGTHDFVSIPEEKRDPKTPWKVVDVKANGRHGRLMPCGLWGHLHVWPGKDWKWDERIGEQFPEKTLVFEGGRVVYVSDTTTRQQHIPWYNQNSR